MLNEVRARHIRKLVVDQIAPGRTVGGILQYEIASREHTIGSLDDQVRRELDEITFLKSLDAKELHKEAGEKKNGK